MTARHRLSWGSLLTVMVGGAAGVCARAAITLPVAGLGDALLVPGVTLAINVVGAFLLGLLIGRLGDRRRGIRLFLGTGVLGGFTTYSAFAVDAVGLFTAAPVVGLVLILITLAGGTLAAVAGVRLGAPRSARAPREPEAAS